MADLLSPLKFWHVTQEWGVNPHIYARFGLQGHNGIDLRLFTDSGVKAPTAILYAPHDGVIREAAFDADGYGNYFKLENDHEGSILAHLASFAVRKGERVKRGQRLGICGNTGFSTAPHLHWGYYPIPRNKKNGYSGTIDQTKYRTIQTDHSAPVEKEDDMSSTLLAYLGATNEKDAVTRLKEHLGEWNGTCDWGNADGEDRGGFLGAERRARGKLEHELMRAQAELEVTENMLSEAAERSEKYETDMRRLTEKLEAFEAHARQNPALPGIPENAKLNGLTRSYRQGDVTITENYEIV